MADERGQETKPALLGEPLAKELNDSEELVRRF